jgi:8-oxo-dGTP pyrophosphatase MutT (NUDIX family)
MYRNLLAEIKYKLTHHDLPGREAMLDMAPLSRRKEFPLRDDHNLASVMLLLYPNENSLTFPLIIRTNQYPNDKHGGQIAFPGGKREAIDPSNWHCAMRECREELGIEANGLEKLGKLTPNYIPISNYMVHPFVGYVNKRPTFNRQVDEVAGIIEVDLTKLLDEQSKTKGEILLANGKKLNNIPYFNLKGKKVWGATAMMLNEFVELIR